MFFNFWFFFFLIGITIGITSSARGLKIRAITAVIKKYKLIIKEKKRRHDKLILLASSKSNSIEILISKSLIDSAISYDEVDLINNVLKKDNKIKGKNYSLKTNSSLSKILIYL